MHPAPQFEEIDYRETELGDLILRRRTVLALDNLEVYEIILGNAFLMSSMFTVVEEALSKLGLAAAAESTGAASLDVVVGGLGLGYTARAALEEDADRKTPVGSLLVVDYLKPVIEWHEQELVPLGRGLNADPRFRYVLGDFFKLAVAGVGEGGFDPESPGRKFHAVLLDIDHSPDHLLHEGNAEFYQTAGLRRLADQLYPGGVFALWSNDPPDDGFMKTLEEVFASCESHEVSFHNPLQEKDSKSTVYVACLSRDRKV